MKGTGWKGDCEVFDLIFLSFKENEEARSSP